jgi:hypothetical protein
MEDVLGAGTRKQPAAAKAAVKAEGESEPSHVESQTY